MARVDTLKSEIATLGSKGAALTKDLAKHQETSNKAQAAATRKRSEAVRTKSESTRRLATSAAEREEKKSADALKKVAELQGKIASNNKSIASKQSSLSSALKDEQRARDREEERRRRSERTEAQKRDREDSKRRQTEKDHARELGRISRASNTVRYVEVRPPKPERLRVLYLTANPEATERTVTHPNGVVERIGTWLRVDQEVRQVRDMLKRTRFRDLVTVEYLPAATRMDLLEGLNEHRPHIVHFSGHSNSIGLLMEDDDGTENGVDVTFDLLGKLLEATDSPPQLVVLNSCESLAGADSLLRTVPTIVAMSDEIDDASALVFSGRFYAAIASAQSVTTALKQAKVSMEAASLESAHLPQARARDDVNLDELVLVTPPPDSTFD